MVRTHMGPYEVNRQRRIDRKFSQFLAFPKSKEQLLTKKPEGGQTTYE